MNPKVKIGDVVKIVDVRCHYDMYEDWAKIHNLGHFVKHLRIRSGQIVEVVAVGEHEYQNAILVGIRTDAGNETIVGIDAVELAQKGEEVGNTFNRDDLKVGQRVVVKSGDTYIAMPYAGGMTAIYGDVVLVNHDANYPWTDFYTPESDRAAMSGDHMSVAAVAVYAPSPNIGDMLNPKEKGDLVWEYKPKVVEKSEFEKRVEFFQTHIDAVKENLASLEAEFEQLKTQGE